MPRDKRLYMTFPIDFADHPKVEQLSDRAFRVFVAMNGYSRVHRLDGRIPIPVALKRWGKRPLSELIKSDDGRPLVMLENVYVIRDYAEHQFTTTDEAELHQKRSAAGAKGGKAKANAVALAKQIAGKDVTESESESESGLLTDVTDVSESSHLSDARAADFDAMSTKAKLAGIGNLEAVAAHLARAAGYPVSAPGALVLASAIVAKSAQEVRNVDAYVATVCRDSAPEVQQAYFDLDIEAYAS